MGVWGESPPPTFENLPSRRAKTAVQYTYAGQLTGSRTMWSTNATKNRAKIKHRGQLAYYRSHFCRAKLLTLPTYIEVMSLPASPEDS